MSICIRFFKIENLKKLKKNVDDLYFPGVSLCLE